jgi:hypothetical protein
MSAFCVVCDDAGDALIICCIAQLRIQVRYVMTIGDLVPDRFGFGPPFGKHPLHRALKIGNSPTQHAQVLLGVDAEPKS